MTAMILLPPLYTLTLREIETRETNVDEHQKKIVETCNDSTANNELSRLFSTPIYTFSLTLPTLI